MADKDATPAKANEQVTMAEKDVTSSLANEYLMFAAQQDMEYRVESFNKLTSTCFNKCVDKRYKESELYLGENTCIDRCVSKYYQVINLIGKRLASGLPPV